MPEWIYLIFGMVTLLAVLGGVRLIVRRGLTATQWVGRIMLITMYLAYGVVIVISLRLIVWQGREMFSALSSIAGLFGLGLARLVLGRAAVQPAIPTARWRRRLAAGLVPAVTAGLFAVNLYSVVGLVGPLLNGP